MTYSHRKGPVWRFALFLHSLADPPLAKPVGG